MMNAVNLSNLNHSVFLYGSRKKYVIGGKCQQLEKKEKEGDQGFFWGGRPPSYR